MVHEGIYAGSRIVEKTGPNPSEISRRRWPCGRDRPVVDPRFGKYVLLLLCVFALESGRSRGGFSVASPPLDRRSSSDRAGCTISQPLSKSLGPLGDDVLVPVCAKLSSPNLYEFTGSGAMYVTASYTCIWFGDIHGPKPYVFIGYR